MNKIVPVFFILLLISGLQTGCSGKTGLPEGAQKTAEYSGSFDGYKTEGIIQINLYLLPDGSTICKGFFKTMPDQSFWHLTGSVQDNQIQGSFQASLTGQFSGTLSPDAATMSGKYEITSPTTGHGTWEGKK